jgi:hypothetical protein
VVTGGGRKAAAIMVVRGDVEVEMWMVWSGRVDEAAEAPCACG